MTSCFENRAGSLFCRVLTVWYSQLLVSDNWKLSDMLAGGGVEDTHGLMTHKIRGSEMEVVIWRVSPDKTQFKQTFAVLLGHHPLTFLLLGAKTCRSPSG